MTSEVPKGWLRSDLGPHVAILSGFAFSSSRFTDSADAGLPLVRIRDLVSHAPSTFFSGDYDDQYVVRRDDTLVGMDGDFVVARWSGPPSLLNQRVCRVSASVEHVDKQFLRYVLIPLVDKIHGKTSATTVKHLSTKQLRKATVLFPPLPEQRRIAAILSSVDEAIQATQAVIEQTSRVKEGLLQHLLTRGIDHTRFKQTEIGEIPQGWEVVGISSLFNRLRVPRTHDKSSRSETGTALILDQSTDDWFGFHDGEPDLPASVSAPLVTFANHTCAVRFMTEPFSVIQNVFPLSALNDVHPRFLFWGMSQAVKQDGYRGHWPEVKRCRFAKPPLIEQGQIATRLDALEMCEAKSQLNLGHLQQVKAGLLQDLLTGKVRVSV